MVLVHGMFTNAHSMALLGLLLAEGGRCAAIRDMHLPHEYGYVFANAA